MWLQIHSVYLRVGCKQTGKLIIECKMTINQFIKKTEFSSDMTQLQKQNLLDNLIGDKIDMSGLISDIGYDGISLENQYKYEYLNLNIKYDKTRMGKELLSYSQFDEVNISTQIKSVSSLGIRIDCYLELLSISRVSTRVERDKIQAIENEKIYKQTRGWTAIKMGIGGTLGGAAMGFVVALVFEIGSCVYNRTERGMNKYTAFIFLTCTIGGAILSSYAGYTDRSPKD